jgi:YVTN family beta-propeller protein
VRYWRCVIPMILLLTLLLNCKDAFDVQAPQVEVLSPMDGSQAVGDVQIVVRARDANLSKVLVYMDDQFIHESTEDSFGFVYNIPDSNKHTIKARATDRRGNWGVASIMVNPVAELQITSVPSGANVWLNGQETGDTTDCLLTDVKPGLHTVKLTKPGCFDWEDTVTVVYKQRAKVEATLVADVGSVQVSSSPTGATVWLDGQNTGNNTNCTISDVPTGLHTLKLTKTDYWDWQDTVTVTLGGTSARDATLTPNPYPDSLIAAITLGDYYNPCALAWNSTNNRIYCANSGKDNVSVIDCVTNQVVSTVSTGSYPCAIAWNPMNNLVYVANKNSDNVTVFDAATNAYVTTIRVCYVTGYDEPVDVVCNPTGNKVYCSRDGYGSADTIVVISGATNQVVARIPIENGAGALEWNATNNKLYTGSSYKVTVIDGTTDQVVTTVSVPGFVDGFAWNETNNAIYCSHGGTMSVIDGANNQLITTISSVGSDVKAIVWNRANNKIYGADLSTDKLVIIDCWTNSVVARLDAICYTTRGLAYDAQGNRIYATYNNTSGTGRVMVVGARRQ